MTFFLMLVLMGLNILVDFIAGNSLIFFFFSGYHDVLPDIIHTAFATSIRFGPFRDIVYKMGAWLKDQKVSTGSIYDRLRSTSGLKLESTDIIISNHGLI